MRPSWLCRYHRALFALLVLLTIGTPVHAAIVSVPAGGNLQAALNAAQPGDIILLQPGALYIGNFTLPNKAGASYILLMTSAGGLPDVGVRMGPAYAPLLAKLRSPNGDPALRTAAGAHHWWIALVEFLANAGGAGDIIALGDGSSAQNSLAAVPHDLVIERCYIHGEPGAPQKRGIALNSASTTVTGSYIAEIKSDWQDSQAIGGWNGPGPYTITNNYLEAAGENVMFGGADPSIANLVPSDITITNNTFSKPTAWRLQSWVVKNLFELKNARRVTVRGNTFEYNWPSAQSGFSILFTVRNQDGGCPWCQVEDVVFEENIVRHVAAGVNILGYDNNHPSLQTRRITIRNNLFVDIDTARWGGNGYFLQLLGGAADITVDHNTIVQPNASGILTADGPPIQRFTFTNNLVRHNAYGIIGTDHAPGNDTIASYFPGSVIAGNVIADATPTRYPANNLFPSSTQFAAEFVSYAAGDYRLKSISPWRSAGTDGREIGAFLAAGASRLRVNLDMPGAGQQVGQPFTVAGWAVDEGNPGGTGIDAVHVYAYPSPGSGQPPVFLGRATHQLPRPDVGQAFGARFATAGFSLQARGLPPGVYQVVAFARSTLTEQFTAAAATVTVQTSTTLVVDYPVSGASVGRRFAVAGWAADTSAVSGVGVDAIDVWAYPSSGAAPIFVGGSVPQYARPDVAAHFGSSQFTNSGYRVEVSGLALGDYQLVVFARSTVSGAFTSRALAIKVVQTATMNLDRPAQNAVVAPGFDVAGWAVDTAAASGTGISTVHVWAHPAGGGAALFLGEARYGGERPDIGALFGAQFARSGFSLTPSNLAPGAYDIVAYGFSTVSNSFSAVSARRISISSQ